MNTDNPSSTLSPKTSLPQFTLISHILCPFVQRAAIVLDEKNIAFKRIDIDLNNKPDWFLKLSPLGKVPVLVINDETVIFESAVIAEYIDEISEGSLLSHEPTAKARERAWIEFSSSFIFNIASLYSAREKNQYFEALKVIKNKLRILESNMSDNGFFSGPTFGLVDVSLSPAFRYFAVLQPVIGEDVFKDLNKTILLKKRLLNRQSVINAVQNDYSEQLLNFVENRDSHLANLVKAHNNKQAA